MKREINVVVFFNTTNTTPPAKCSLKDDFCLFSGLWGHSTYLGGQLHSSVEWMQSVCEVWAVHLAPKIQHDQTANTTPSAGADGVFPSSRGKRGKNPSAINSCFPPFLYTVTIFITHHLRGAGKWALLGSPLASAAPWQSRS